MLDIVNHQTHSELGAQGAVLAQRAIARAHAGGREATVLLAAAPSQLPVLKALSRLSLHDHPVRYFHMDEYIGLPPGAPQSFGAWLQANYFSALPNGHEASFEPIPTSGVPSNIARAYADKLTAGTFDLVLCGIGINGHLAFNDPGCDLKDPLPVREIRLSVESRSQQVDEGHFQKLNDVPETAITLTVPRIMAARTIVCSVLGSAKAAAMKDLVTSIVTNRVPATALKTHPDAIVLADSEAMSLVD